MVKLAARERLDGRWVWGVGLMLVSLGQIKTGSAMQKDELSKLVDLHVRPIMDAELAPGMVVAIHRDGETRFFCYGSTHLDQTHVPTAETVYETGSVGKVFTALMLAESVRRGEVSLDTPIQQLMPEGTLAPERNNKPIRLWHLASHTSGLPRQPDNFESVLEGDPYQGYSEEKLWDGLRQLKLEREPELDYEYSNLGAGLLAVLLEHRLGQTYQQQLIERIAQPLGMNDTTLVLSASQTSRLAQPTSAGMPTVAWGTEDALKGAGAIRSTPADLIRFAISQFEFPDHPIAEAIKLAHQPRHTSADGEKVGLGWHIDPDGETYWHNGSTGGYHSYLAFHARQRWALVMLANTDAYEITLAADRLARNLAGETVAAIDVRKAERIDPQNLQRLVGTYRSSDDLVIHVRRREDKLLAQIEGQIALRVYPESATRFFYREVDAELEFEANNERPALAVTILQEGGRIRCVRQSQ